MTEIDLEIDGQPLKAKANQTIIEVADAAGLYIPRFCYHPHLTVAANCRMCVVEVEKSPKVLPACATPVMPGMKVYTKSEKTRDAQRAVMAYLLINHPLDCPICDQGGECELQDLAMGYGSGASSYRETKRAVLDHNLGPLIASDMTRCIYCTRCVRFGAEIAGLREMGGTYRGEETEIGPFVEKAITSEVSGNIIDLCPVGALTSKPYRFTARPWELQEESGVSPHDCVGSSLALHTRNGKVMRVVARQNDKANAVWLSDRDRFSYTGLYHPDRIGEPLIREEGTWKAVSWSYALQFAADGLKEIIARHGIDKCGVLVSPNATLEEFFLLQKFLRALGGLHIDHRLREKDTQDQSEMPAFPGINIPIAALQKAGTILLIGSNIQKEQPVAALWIRKAQLKGATILAVNPIDYDFHFELAAKRIIAPHEVIRELKQLIHYLKKPEADVHESIKCMANALKKPNAYILLGALTQHHSEASTIRALSREISVLTDAKIGFLTEGANAAGAWLAGAIPHRNTASEALAEAGLSTYEMLEKPRKAYLLFNVEPDKDFANTQLAMHAFKQADYLIAFSCYRNMFLESHAHVILPIASFAETAGTFVNASGDWQSFKAAANVFENARPAWEILKAFAQLFSLNEFDFEHVGAVREKVEKMWIDKPLIAMTPSTPSLKESPTKDHKKTLLSRIGEIPLYATDSLVRRALPLQKAQKLHRGEMEAVYLHPETALELKLKQGQIVDITQGANQVKLPLLLDERIAKNAALLAGGIAATANLGDLLGELSIC